MAKTIRTGKTQGMCPIIQTGALIAKSFSHPGGSLAEGANSPFPSLHCIAIR